MKALAGWCGVVAAAVLAFACVAVGQEEDKVKRELEKLQGTWRTVASESEGQKIEAVGAMPAVTIDGDQYLVNYPASQSKGRKLSGTTIKIDPSKKPKTIDFTKTDGSDDDDKGKPAKGIYQLDGDTLRICFNPDKDGERPTEFATKSGSRVRYVTLKRGKP